MNWLQRLTDKLFGPVRSFTEEEAYLAGYASEEGEKNNFTTFADRRAWREGREDANKWNDRAL